jgi:hypothetical protein
MYNNKQQNIIALNVNSVFIYGYYHPETSPQQNDLQFNKCMTYETLNNRPIFLVRTHDFVFTKFCTKE